MIDIFSNINADFALKKLDLLENNHENIDLNFFDASKAERSLKFLDYCMNLCSTQDREDTKRDLEAFLRKCFSRIKEKISVFLDEIIETKITVGEEQKQVKILRKYAEKIEEIFCEVKQISPKYSLLAEYHPRGGFFEGVERKLSQASDDLVSKIEKEYSGKNIQEIKSMLPILKVLSQLDEYIKGEKFDDIFKRFQDIYHSGISDLEKEAITAFETLNFQDGVAAS